MINSGYNANEVQESSKYLGTGSLSMQEKKPEEELVMPEQKKSLTSKLKFWGNSKKPTNQIPKPSESMKLSSEPLNKENLAETKTIQQMPTQPKQATQKYTLQEKPVPGRPDSSTQKPDAIH